MSLFTKQNLFKSAGGYVIFKPADSKERVVARFKVGGTGTFMTLLRKKFTVEEYFSRLDAGETPLKIAESKGYLLPHVKRELKRLGYPLTRAGKAQLIQDQVAAWNARQA